MTETQSLIRKAVQERLEGGPGGGAELKRSTWVYTAPAGTQVADILQASYWAGLHPMPQPWDHIEVREELGAWYAELLVRSSTSDGIVVAGIKAIELESVAPRNFQPTNLEGCQVVYLGPFLKWCVTRPDGTQLQGGFDDEKRAAQWLADHIRTVKHT